MTEPVTKLLDKHYSPLVIRKSNLYGFPLYVAIICDLNLDSLDKVILDACGEAETEFDMSSIQGLRNFVGRVSECITDHYNTKKVGCVEGIAVILYADKTCISSLWGDFMNHNMCRLELYTLLNFMTQV